MRFISHIRNHMVQIQQRRAEQFADGGERELQPMIVARFHMQDITPDEVAFAEREFSPNGRTTELDTVTMTPLLGRLSVFDSVLAQQAEGWDDETRELVERVLLKRSETSRTFKPFIPAPALPPWPTYDAFPGDEETLVAVVVEQGHHLPAALAYEQANQNRPLVVEMLQAEIEKLQALQQTEFVQA